jgi:hypothetical protein
MNMPFQPSASKQFALLVTLIGILVVVLAIALYEMRVTVHQAGDNNECLIGCDSPHDASLDGLSCTECHQFQNNGLVQGNQITGEWDTWNAWYAPIFAGAGFLLGELPEQMSSQETGHSNLSDNAGTDQSYQPARSEAMVASNRR